MTSEINDTKKYFDDKFGIGNRVPAGEYAVPYESSRGKAFMRVRISDDVEQKISGIYLFWDEALTIDWYYKEKNGKPRICLHSHLKKQMGIIKISMIALTVIFYSALLLLIAYIYPSFSMLYGPVLGSIFLLIIFIGIAIKLELVYKASGFIISLFIKIDPDYYNFDNNKNFNK